VSTPREPQPGKIVLSVLAAGPWWEQGWPQARAELAGLFGPTDYESGPIGFDHTAYYDEELGAPLFRRLLGFERLVALDSLRDLKLATNALERKAARTGGARRVNLDPGILTLERLVLASGKNFTHRVYVGGGIWADLTLIYSKARGWVDLPWTFPDYADADMKRRLTQLRALYKTAVEAAHTRPQKGDDTCP
jgi:hypothetical protein